jgi:hypothetical protein
LNLETSGNLVEAVLWIAVALAFIVKAIKASRQLRRVFLFLAAAFVVFGTTDVIESETGAWWRPTWLLVVKVICVASFALGFAAYFSLARRKQNLFDPPGFE